MPKFRSFRIRSRTLRLEEGVETRKRDIKNWAITVTDVEEDAVYTYFQSRSIRQKITGLPLSVKIYNTPREILESMLRAAVSDTSIEDIFDFSPAACRKRGVRGETRTLKSIATQAALSASEKTFRAKIEDRILLLKVLSKEFGTREAEEYAIIVFEKLVELFQKVVVDIREVTYINSTGISVLARTASEMPMRIVGASDNVRSIMDLMGLLPLLALDGTQEEALKNLLEEEGKGPTP
ncbi:MAG: STAS domain-containing protein [Planctomycetota bacterium]